MKNILTISMFSFLIFLFSTCNSKKESNSDAKSASIVFPVTIDAFEQLKNGFINVCGDSIDYHFYSAEGDPSKFETAIQSALLSNPDYLITIGTQITNSAFGPKFKSKLNVVVAAAISSPELVNALVKVGIEPPRNMPVVIISDSPKEDIYSLVKYVFTSTMPNALKVGVIYNNAEINSKETATRIANALNENGIIIVDGLINSIEDVEKIANNLILNNVDAIIIPHDKNAVTKASSIVKICSSKGIPVFSLDDGTVKKDGVAIGVSVNYKIIGELIGETILKLKNKSVNAELLPIIQVEKASIYVNTKTIKELGINISNLNDSIITY